MSASVREQKSEAVDVVQAIPPHEIDDEYHGSSSPNTKSTTTLEKKRDWWLVELGALLLSALTIVGMGLFLRAYDQKPAPSWSYNYNDALTNLPPAIKAKQVTINSILSLFSATSRILLGLPLAKALGQLMWVHYLGGKDRKLADVAIFDKATRKDHIGAVELVWMLKARHFAVVGAVVIFGLTALDNIIQLLVHQPIRYWPDDLHQVLPNSSAVAAFDKSVQAFNLAYPNNPNATLPEFKDGLQVARISNATVYAPQNVGTPLLYDLDIQMKANIWAGVFGEDSLGGWRIPTYYCTTGNCTWKGYSSLGVCSRCANITTKLNKSCNAHAADLNNATGCDVRLPNGFSLGGPESRRDHLTAVSTDYAPMIYGNYSASLAAIQAITTTDDTLFVNQSTPLLALECVMVPCVIKYSESFVLNTDLFAKYGLSVINYYEFVDTIYDNFSLVNSAPTIDVPFNASRNDPTTYQMSGAGYANLKAYLQSMFNGFQTTNGTATTLQGENTTRPVEINTKDIMQSLLTPIENCYDIFGTQVNDSISCTIQTAAMAITKTIRDADFSAYNFTQYAATGITWSPKPMIDVAWLWIIPITALWVLCAILALGTMWKARDLGVSGMVLNPLTLLFANVEDRNDSEGVPSPWWHSGGEAKKLAEHMQVRLTMNERKVSFVQRVGSVEGRPVSD